jgi:hypothetical protein
MTALGLLALAGLLSACAVAPDPKAPMIEVATTSFHGSTRLQIFADGTRIESSGGAPVTTQMYPEAYERAAAILTRQGLAAKAALVPPAAPCLDYGTDLVRAVPPVAGFDAVSTDCPDPGMTALMAALTDTLRLP